MMKADLGQNEVGVPKEEKNSNYSDKVAYKGELRGIFLSSWVISIPQPVFS